MTRVLLLSVILLPALAAAALPFLKFSGRRPKMWCIFGVLLVEAVLSTLLLFQPEEHFLLFSMTQKLNVALKNDPLSKVFTSIAAYGFLVAGIFAFRYMDEEEKEGAFPENVFFAFFLLSLAALMGMDLSSNLISMYFFFEMITLLSMPLVLHERSEESIQAALKYLFYSVAGAFLALGCIFVLSNYSDTLDFMKGGSLNMSRVSGHETLILIMSFLGILGFGAKAGMYPLHGWLPTAHPVAPAPASAVLSAVIAKAGVLAIIRVIYFSVGASFVSGTWVQTAWLSISLLTVFMGSMMAYREKVFKKRLAYSSVSQISYALFGLFLLNGTGIVGGLMQVLFHACVKICLFLTAGTFIYVKGFRKVDELKGIGKQMPITLMAFTLASLSLIGIPPFAGFVCKWYLADGALSSGIAVINWLGPVVLLISALLTAGYLLPITVGGFFPGKNFVPKAGKKAEESDFLQLRTKHDDKDLLLILPLVILAGLSLIMGIFSGAIGSFLETVVATML